MHHLLLAGLFLTSPKQRIAIRQVHALLGMFQCLRLGPGGRCNIDPTREPSLAALQTSPEVTVAEGKMGAGAGRRRGREGHANAVLRHLTGFFFFFYQGKSV